MTDSELKVIAAPAIIGLSTMPKGQRTPAAVGTRNNAYVAKVSVRRRCRYEKLLGFFP